ncbi:c-type cytochrome [Adhaeribacter radiodurans]|uniref:C-type cytochrome n=2 Tax=Adhaeribacter radiodurans TaxID=2745197 RepID=A0A7L7LFP8_9BACT|nr:c-type cytochrome [Adhaeribacter radiodurans]
MYLLVALLGGTSIKCKQQKEAASTGGIPPEKALSTFELEPGFKIELVAAEPLVADPVAMEIDENGRMYVVEMHGYPLDKSGTGKIKLLTDTNGDGRMDKSTTFAEGLMLPTGIMRWKKGVLVTDPPNVLYLEDTDGDNQADVKKTMLTGFAVSNPQHNLNNPLLGLDNWIYVGHESAVTAKIYKEEFGDPGKDILYPDKPKGPRLANNANGRSVRFRPDEYALETTSGDTQFGHTFDTWGRYFQVSNANHIFQEVIAEPYLRRNPDLLVTDATQSLSDHENAAEVFPITKNPENQLLTDVGVITSACALTYYQGGAFPEEFNNNVTFVAEPVSNLVHVDRLKPKGASFAASRLRPHKEFLASTDAWFRPVNMYTGPDGALYLVDYYRQIIEHPEWMAEDVVKSGALYNGTDKGRIYRISAQNAKPATWTQELNLGKATDEQLIAKLAEPNIWWRRNAQRLLVDRNSKQAVPTLRQIAQNPTSALGRLHALWTLEGMHQLRPDLIIKALQDPEQGIRENAIKLAELHLKESPDLTSNLISLQNDANSRVRYQLLCTLGFINTPEVNQVRQQLLFKDINDEWVQVAALSALSGQNAAFLESVLAQYKSTNPAYASLVQRLSAMVGARQEPETVRRLLQKATTPITGEQGAWQAPVLAGLAQGLKSRKVMPTELQTEQNVLIQTCLKHPVVSVREGALQILQAIGLLARAQTQNAMQQAREIASNQNLPEDQRAIAIEFLALRNPETDRAFLRKLINPREPLPVQLAALHTLSAIPDLTVSTFVLQQWPSLSPDVRDAAINTFMSKPERIRLLLDALEEGKIQTASIGWPRSVSLMAQEDEKLRSRARALLTKKEDKRQEVIQEYQTALNLGGDKVQGKAVFQRNCSVCHQIRGNQGVAFGPDLGTIHNWPPTGILSNVLDPNQSISDGYDMWEVALTNGKSVQGIIATETPNALTLRNAGGQVTTIARQDIRALKALGMSAMPTGLEKQINKQQMANLLAYLRQVE